MEKSTKRWAVFGELLKGLRKERRVYQREMGELLKVTLRHYQRLERGEINVTAATLCRLADYFGVTTDYLPGRSEERA